MRVIAGFLGGRRFSTPRGRATRPTSDRVREAIFSSLGDVRDARVLDLFSGSGAFGIEALSRGAASLVCVENAPQTLKVLRRNLRDLQLDDCTEVFSASVDRAVLGLHERRFDLVFADPPYAQLANAVAALTVISHGAETMAVGARVVVEHSARDECPNVPKLEHLRTRRYGDTAVSFYVVAPTSVPVPD